MENIIKDGCGCLICNPELQKNFKISVDNILAESAETFRLVFKYDPIELKRLEINKSYNKLEIETLELRNKEIKTLLNKSGDDYVNTYRLKEEYNTNLNIINKLYMDLINIENKLTELYQADHEFNKMKTYF